jgi:RNA recognition motif-containing protein
MVSPSANYHSLEVRFQARLPFTKHLSLKPHSSRKDDLPAGRTLFVAGIPVTISANDLVELFSAFGNVSSLAVHPTKVGL